MRRTALPSFMARLLLSHLLVAVLTSVSLALLSVLSFVLWGPRDEPLVFALAGVVVEGVVPSLLAFVAVMLVAATPPALLLAWLLARPLARRLQTITETSARFAGGELQARIGDGGSDAVGVLARQFDDMADTVQGTIGALRDLAHENVALAQRAEQAAIQAERLRLARELHDDIAQQLFSLSLRAAALPTQIAHDAQRATEEAEAIAALAERTLVDLRTVLVDLRPPELARRGLAEALGELCRRWQTTHTIPLDCALVLSGRYLPRNVEDVVYRVAQEALGNVAKHARARNVALSLLEGQRRLTLSVSDDGRGFAVEQPRGEQFGLLGMHERARAIGGTLELESAPRQGTTLRLTLPLPETKEQ